MKGSIQMSPNKPRYTVSNVHRDALHGLKFFSLKNKSNSYIIPSTKNFLNDIQIKGLKVDQGATITLLPIASIDVLEKLFSDFPREQFIFAINELRTFGGPAYSLMIQPNASNETYRFQLYLGCDIYPSNTTANLIQQFDHAANPISSLTLPSFLPSFQMKFVHFYLSSEDIRYIVGHERMLAQFTSESSVATLRSLAGAAGQLPHRSDGLIGKDVLENSPTVKYKRVELFFDPTVHRLNCLTWNLVSEISVSISSMKYLRDNVDVDFLEHIQPSDIIFESDEFDPENDAIDV
jgi:hypothetical protein